MSDESIARIVSTLLRDYARVRNKSKVHAKGFFDGSYKVIVSVHPNAIYARAELWRLFSNGGH